MATALITGASSGLGREFAIVLAERGYELLLVARNRQTLTDLAKNLSAKFKVKVEIYTLDLSVAGSAKRLFLECEKRRLTIDVLINNAGYGVYGPFIHSDIQKSTAMTQLNCVTLAELAWAFGRPMLKRKYGHILNVASTASFAPGPFMAIYYASKAFVLSLSEALYFEFRGTGVHVSVLCPGPTQTEFFKRADIKVSPVKHKLMRSPRQCAERGISGLFAGQCIIIDGAFNSLIVFALRFAPRWLVRQLSASLLLTGKG